MVPDFDRLRKQSCDRTALRSVKATALKGFTPKIIFQHFDTKPTHSPTRAKPGEIDHLFFQLWLSQPSWSPIIKKANGWITIVNKSGKKVPLVLGTIQSHYRRDIVLGKRFGKLTNYLMIDIDINSPFHPRNGGIEQILAAMESIGLCRYLLIRSSASEGIHIYFPLAEPVNAWAIACVAHAALTAAGITVAGGICELFPNKRALNAEHNGHRLPLQAGSFLLDKDFCPISNHKADFLARWQTAATHQGDKKLQRALSGNTVYASPSIPVEPSPTVTAPQSTRPSIDRAKHVLPPIAWTNIGQSNDVMRELVNYGDRYVGHKNIEDLADWVRAVAPQLPGYEQFASPKSKRDIERGTWPRRWATSHFSSVYAYKVGGTNHNANVAHDAKSRIFAALDLMCVTATINVTELFGNIASIARRCLNKGIHWNTLKKYETEIWAYIKRPGAVGLSSGDGEDTNSFSEELTAAQIIEAELSGRKSYTELLTLRCVADIYSNAFAQLHTPKNEGASGGGRTANFEAKLPDERATSETTSVEDYCSVISAVKDESEGDIGSETATRALTVGQAVRIVMPGGSLDGIETQVLAQALDVLGLPVYRLDYRRQGRAVTLPAECLQIVEAKERALPGEAVIRATAAQLMQVLGQACPFVGPGLWSVRRGEVSDKDWGQLSRLVGER